MREGFFSLFLRSVFFVNIADCSERDDIHFLFFLIDLINCRVGSPDVYAVSVLVSFQFFLIPAGSGIGVDGKKAESSRTLQIFLVGKIV